MPVTGFALPGPWEQGGTLASRPRRGGGLASSCRTEMAFAPRRRNDPPPRAGRAPPDGTTVERASRAGAARPLRPAHDRPSVIGWMPAAAVFFHDPDGHLLEHLAMLPHQPHPEAGIVLYGEWMARWARSGPASAGPAGTKGSGER